MRILAVDPGQTCGWAAILDGQVMTFGSPKGENEIWRWITDLLEDSDYFDVFVVEDFKIRPGINFSWAQMFPIQVIGALKLVAFQLGIQTVLQQPSIKPMAYGQIGLTYKKGAKNKHVEDAIAHGMWYWNHHGKKTTH